jgi:hypothetical protein
MAFDAQYRTVRAELRAVKRSRRVGHRAGVLAGAYCYKWQLCRSPGHFGGQGVRCFAD